MKTKLQSKPASGFTLVELMISLAVLSMVLTAVVSASITSSRMIYRLMAEGDVVQEVRYIQSLLARDIYEGEKLSVDSATGKLTIQTEVGIIDYYIETSNSGDLTLVRDDEAGNLKRTVLDDISGVTFSVPNYSYKQVLVDIAAFVKVGGGRDVERNFTSRFTSREEDL